MADAAHGDEVFIVLESKVFVGAVVEIAVVICPWFVADDAGGVLTILAGLVRGKPGSAAFPPGR